MDQLKEEESRIDLSILRHQAGDDRERKKRRFQRTVEAVRNIVSSKLYKAKTSSLEAYFRNEWKISRAQVYRFLDCAVILEELGDFAEQPSRERLCRSLKKLAKTKEDRRTLWRAVLNRFGSSDIDTVTSTAITQIWEDLVSSGEVIPSAGEERSSATDIKHHRNNLADGSAKIVASDVGGQSMKAAVSHEDLLRSEAMFAAAYNGIHTKTNGYQEDAISQAQALAAQGRQRIGRLGLRSQQANGMKRRAPAKHRSPPTGYEALRMALDTDGCRFVEPGGPANAPPFGHETSLDVGLQAAPAPPPPQPQQRGQPAAVRTAGSGPGHSPPGMFREESDFSLFHRLTDQGYVLQPFFGGNWCAGVQDWRLVRMDDSRGQPAFYGYGDLSANSVPTGQAEAFDLHSLHQTTAASQQGSPWESTPPLVNNMLAAASYNEHFPMQHVTEPPSLFNSPPLGAGSASRISPPMSAGEETGFSFPATNPMNRNTLAPMATGTDLQPLRVALPSTTLASQLSPPHSAGIPGQGPGSPFGFTKRYTPVKKPYSPSGDLFRTNGSSDTLVDLTGAHKPLAGFLGDATEALLLGAAAPQDGLHDKLVEPLGNWNPKTAGAHHQQQQQQQPHPQHHHHQPHQHPHSQQHQQQHQKTPVSHLFKPWNDQPGFSQFAPDAQVQNALLASSGLLAQEPKQLVLPTPRDTYESTPTMFDQSRAMAQGDNPGYSGHILSTTMPSSARPHQTRVEPAVKTDTVASPSHTLPPESPGCEQVLQQRMSAAAAAAAAAATDHTSQTGSLKYLLN